MRLADWLVMCATLTLVVLYGLWRSRGCRNIDHFTLADRTMPWYAVALSIMATQASAVTFISTAGQSYVDGMRFVQFYFGLPLAMIILCFTAVPLFHRAKIYTAYQYLERRFDLKTGVLVSIIFLLQRGLALGISLYAPAVVLTVIFGWPDWATTLIMGGIAIIFTTMGGVKATAWAHMLQMVVMSLALVGALACAVFLLPAHVSFADAVNLAEAAGKLNVVTTHFDWNDRYNLWSGLFGGMFLALAYFGTDQSQVQRYLTGSSIAETRRGLMFNAAAKIPMQLFILFIGAMVFVFYIYEPPPMLFERTEMRRLESAAVRNSYDGIAQNYKAAFENRRAAADRLIAARHSSDPEQIQRARSSYLNSQSDFETARKQGAALIRKNGGRDVNDTNYIFLTFVTRYLPAGMVGLTLAMVLGATMSSMFSEMNALATVTMIDVYQRLVRKESSGSHYLRVTRFATLLWGGYAVITAQYMKHLGSLVEAVNLLGSFFYGGMLGVFVLAWGFPSVTGRGAFWGVLAGEAVIFGCWYFTNIAFLWYNVIGCLVVVLTGLLLSVFEGTRRLQAPVRLPAKINQ